MIKNILYSIFLHFLLLLVIYANFNLKNIDENKSSEIAVSLIALNGDENSNKTKPSSEKNSEEKVKSENKTEQKAKSPKQSPKNQIKEQSKKLTKSKRAKSVAKPIAEEKIQEFKREEKKEEPQKEIAEILENKEENESPDDNKKDASNKEKDSGLKEKSEQEKIDNDKKSITQNSSEMANNLENLDLSVREKFNIQSQLKRCYARAIDETKLSSNVKISLKVHLGEDGYIESDLDDIIDNEIYNDPKEINYKIAIDNARRAIDLCSPLRNLPLDKYYIWKEVIFEFGGE